MKEKKRLVLFIFLRVVVVSLFLVSAIILRFKEPVSLSDEALSGLSRLILATYLFSIVSLVGLRFAEKLLHALTYAQVIWDLVLVTFLILLTGGISSPYSFLYFLSIINASVLLARREAIYTASLCAILYGSILDFQFYGKLNYFGLSQLQAQQLGAGQVFYTVFVNILAYYLTAFLTGYLAERARRSEYALYEREIDYNELERLNSSIVFNLDTGLLTLNNEGKIRVFNRYASELMGISQEDAYDRQLSEISPGMAHLEGDHAIIHRGEADYISPIGVKMILGYKTISLFDNDGSRAGVVMVFQDITKIKSMEAELKKADRMAAIGELSARIAHEIRNPLASISGSVQLIVQGEKVDKNDRKLLNIVQRETDRLNKLIMDFLVYARPVEPFIMPILFKQFLTELSALVRADPLFEHVEIGNNCPEDLTIPGDRNQIQQVFWNLFVNSAEAMPGGGKILVAAEMLDGSNAGICQGLAVKISISDNGKGIPRCDLHQVFEPFYTTKSGGTGLGLATVYRIIDSHGGSIQVTSDTEIGTTFSIYLPLVLE